MTVTGSHIAQTVGRYLDLHPAERPGLAALSAALGTGSDLSSRQTLPGHVTCGTAVLDDAGRVLMIRHKALGKWLLPGGHLEVGDPSLLAGALRELAEETGIGWQQAISPLPMGGVPIDIDLHAIPASPGKDEPAHWHADFRYACRVTSPAVRLQVDEVSDYAWRAPSDLPTPRLVAKVSCLAAAPESAC
jgi:8-oxo-dGTP pyrophosphatase MutT (NUDIX family)